MRLQSFWAEQGCIIWQPYYTQVGAGTMNPATFLRVLGPEPWNVAYVEPSVRPDDGRYGDNPNRMQLHYQYQVILKPDPGNPQELYLQSLEAIGIDRRQHDIRFVEDNWESPALGAWGLGWEVWLDGQEITQFTYFQQAGGMVLNPVSVEITYGLERILIALQGVKSVWEIEWGNGYRYGDALLQSEIEHCRYYFEAADVDALTTIFNTYEHEAQNALEQDPPLVLPAHDYVLKCSHLFNVLDTRGAIGVVERAKYFSRMQTLAARVARAFTDQRHRLEYPTLPPDWEVDAETLALIVPQAEEPKTLTGKFPTRPAPFLLEIGVEELPAADLDSALAQLGELIATMLTEARLDYQSVAIGGTPRRLVAYVDGLSPNQKADERIVRGPPVKVAFDAKGKPTPAAEGFARKNGVPVEELERQEIEGGEYIVAVVREEGRPTPEVLAELLPNLLAAIRFDKSMRWNFSGVAFSRPLRWLVALFGKAVISFSYADAYSGRVTRGTRAEGSPEIDIESAAAYFDVMAEQGILIDPVARRAEIDEQIKVLAKKAGGIIKDDPGLLDEVANLVEQPTALLGSFEQEFLELPEPVLTTVMKKHQRYFAVVDKKGSLLPVFIAVRNGNDEFLAKVIDGNEHVIRARFADARFFYAQDTKHSLAGFLPDLKTLTFQETLGSYYDKSSRLEGLAARLGGLLGLSDDELDVTIRAARLAKADLATQMVVELTSLQGVMGREYALRSGEQPAVAQALAEHYQPRQSGDSLPASLAGITVALADRVDSLVGLLAVGLAPTGSADPYGLRRAALGLVQILLGHHISIDLRQVVVWSSQSMPIEVDEDAQAAVLDFIAGRLRGVLKETYRHDVAEAVLGVLAYDPYRAGIHAEQLAGQVARADWSPILDAYARCVRITRDQKEQYVLKPKAFAEPAEKNLLAAYQKAAKAIAAGTDVDAFITAFEPLVEPISVFFAPAAEGGVLVMDKDPKMRENRLALLQHIVALGSGVADFSQLEGF
ncbi:MAG: glycine--tRNA ligase subunit beta [Anaerolineae bacterium]|nr:glycine--tRNA ligase subunit beta [Anaerolineae bacterium]